MRRSSLPCGGLFPSAQLALISLSYSLTFFLSIQDDSHLNRKIVRKILESAKDFLPELIVVEADDGSTAIEEVKKQRALGVHFDFILIDFIMVSAINVSQHCCRFIIEVLCSIRQVTMNGPEAVRVLRESLGYKGVVVGITGNALPADLAIFRTAGADEVLIKPLTRKKLLDPIQSYLRKV